MSFKSRLGIFCLAVLVSSLASSAALCGQSARASQEYAFREKLGIPKEAKKVIVFAQSSHVDPDWLLTADQYQRLLTDKAFERALIELKKDLRYIYSVECTFFFKRYWDSHPQDRDALRSYVNSGRIKFTGTGVTSPDTLIPEGENLVRDYVIGHEWLKKNGMDVDPKVAYYPDSFGHSPSVPAILRELGYKYTAFTRINGEYFATTDVLPASHYPLPGSAAELLQKKYRTLDFVWQAPDRSEVIAHWNVSTYSMGDMVDTTGITYGMGLRVGVKTTTARSTNAKIDSYIRQLDPLSPTGYMFCPVGNDFNPPVKNLLRFLDTYNKDRYPKTGVYAVLAGLEDYMRLVEFHKSELPVVQLDPNPLFMGFYASRPGLKQIARRLSRSLVLAEMLGVIAEDRGNASYPDLSKFWDDSAFSNHHDFITGTARDVVVRTEQMPVLENAQQGVGKIIASLSKTMVYAPAPDVAAIKWRRSGGVLEVENDFYRVKLDADKGGCITSWFDKKSGREILSGLSNDLVSYYDGGGMWRMGNEFALGKFKENGKASASKAIVSAVEDNGSLGVSVISKLEGRDYTRTLYFRADSPAVRMKIKGSAGKRQTVTVRFQTKIKPGRLVMEIPYGIIERPLEKQFRPTFWPAKNWADLEDASKNYGVALGLSAPAAVHGSADGILELIALRNAYQERVLGMPLFAFPTIGSDPGEYEIDYAFFPHSPGDWLEARVFSNAQNALDGSRTRPQKSGLENPADSLVQIDRSDVAVTAIKKAESGSGVIVRLFRYAPDPVSARMTFKGRAVKKAFLVDGLERELQPLPLRDGKVEIQMPYYLATVLLTF